MMRNGQDKEFHTIASQNRERNARAREGYNVCTESRVRFHYGPGGSQWAVGPDIQVWVDEDGNIVDPTPPFLLKDFISQKHVQFESPRYYAHEAAKNYVLEHLELDIDPDQLLITTLYIDAYDHGDRRANIASSMTLTEAMMRNWQQNGDGHFYDHLGVLEEYRQGGYPARISEKPLPLGECFAYEAIYRKSNPQRFDEGTHVAMDPKKFKRFIWDADLQTRYEKSLTRFWDQHGEDYNLLIKAALLKSAYLQHEEGSLTEDDKALVLNAMGLNAQQPWDTLTFETFRDAPLAPSRFTFRELMVYRYVASGIIVVKDEYAERLVVYIPGNSSPLHAFKDMTALSNWFALQCRHPLQRKALEGQFRAEDTPDGTFLTGIHTALACLAAYPHRLTINSSFWDPAHEIHLGPALSPWPFTHFKRNLRSRLESDGKRLIRSRRDYNEEVAAEILTSAITVTGTIAVAVPFLWIPLVAMSSALIGIGADEAAEGTVEERKEGVGRIVFGVLNAVPALAEGAAGAVEFAGAAARAGDEVTAGAADEVGQKIAGQSEEERAAALAEQQRAQAQAVEESQERASESPGERQTRLDQEEQDRRVLKAHYAATFDSVKAFGIEPDGLRSLTPELRKDLAKLEYDMPLDASGAWTTDDFGAVYRVPRAETGRTRYFARVHSKIYQVERVEEAKQYRIFSEHPALKGPYIKQSKGFYSDIDLRPGLRGGDSYVEVVPEPMPELAPDALKPPHAQPAVRIEIPMDGIETRDAINSAGESVQEFYADGTRVTFDADIAAWRKNAQKVFWRNKKGRWVSGTEAKYLNLTDRYGSWITTEVYEFPRIPGLPSQARAVDRTVHQIWLGDRLPREQLIDTIKGNMNTSPDLKFTLHVDIEDNEALSDLTLVEQLQAKFADYPNMKISNLHNEPFYEGFLSEPETAEPYEYFRSGTGDNFAAASDVLRYRLVREYGGIYMDCDDVIPRSFAGAELLSGPGDLLVGEPVTSARMSYYGPGNSHFASQPGNPVLREMQKELYARFTSERETLDVLSGKKLEEENGINPYMTTISHVTGPRLFMDTIRSTRPDYADLLDGQIKPRSGVSSLFYALQLKDAYDFYAPFAGRLKILAGRENSWIAPRRWFDS